MNLKIYLYAALLAAIAGGGFWFNHVLNERAQLKEDLKASNLSRDTAIAAGFQYQENNERQTKLLSEYQVKLDERQNQITVLERDVSANRKRLSIRATCSPSSSIATDTSSTQTASISDSDTRSAYFSLRRGIVTLEENYALCLQILKQDRVKY